MTGITDCDVCDFGNNPENGLCWGGFIIIIEVITSDLLGMFIEFQDITVMF